MEKLFVQYARTNEKYALFENQSVLKMRLVVLSRLFNC